ncbi:MAG: GFA family protein [Lentisphaerae bacterium]|nr:GFA family protein [Lentisphaerota bacterium]
MAKFEGSCQCGAVTYASDGEPIFVGACHCTNCQKWTGSAFSMMVAVPKPSFTVRGGRLATHHDVGDSGKATHRHFCAACGCTIYDEVDVNPSMVMIPVGTLANPDAVKPQLHVYWKHHASWVDGLLALPKFDALPPH